MTARRAEGNIRDMIEDLVMDDQEHIIHMVYADAREKIRTVSRFAGIPRVEA